MGYRHLPTDAAIARAWLMKCVNMGTAFFLAS
jgi:hypothetical protein